MNTYWFELKLQGPIDLDASSERLYAVCDDGQLAGDERGGSILFSREASSAIDAITSAIDDAEEVGLTVLDVTEDLVSVEEIAEKTERSVAAVGHWTTGKRGGGEFPRPLVGRSSKVRLYSWSEVSQWLASHNLGGVDDAAAETAAAAAEISTLLRARHTMRTASSEYQETFVRILGIATSSGSAETSMHALSPEAKDEELQSPVVLSYVVDDRDGFVEPLLHELTRRGIRSRLDEWKIGSGRNLTRRLFNEGHIGTVVFIASKHSVAKPRLRKELDSAIVRWISAGTRMLAIRLDAVRTTPALEHQVQMDAMRSPDGVREAGEKIAEFLRSNEPPLVTAASPTSITRSPRPSPEYRSYGLAYLDRTTTRQTSDAVGSSSMEHDLAMRLAGLFGGEPTGLPLTEQDLAAWTGSRTVDIRKLLIGWWDRGLISFAPGKITVRDPAKLRQVFGEFDTPSQPSRDYHEWTGRNSTVIFLDIVNFGAFYRTDTDRPILRRFMYEMLQESFSVANISWENSYVEDRGDGALIVVSPDTVISNVTDPLIIQLAEKIAEHNQNAVRPVRLQLRVAVDAGPLVYRSEGMIGDTIIRAARLLEAPYLKDRLALSAADIGLIVSESVYDAIRGGPVQYEPVEITDDEDSGLTGRIRVL